ncbi:flagellar biosynthesis protein FlhF [Ferdinandcohnia quinoae]|uniref:Flagellar biosynthesis protein FlhF n=1 Tax=Fredinandcohnia quinoae TaxID=2918902 RepID=A0AAW5E175_9BACI|nr:flagellar biosynthesis protein FlhF [Fredinandcohnia sp. SECRCQ15]MCH1623766.1 flagellar biosynthesis protein FlhF [Fredinandcohnia sp. SECRCQ15]
MKVKKFIASTMPEAMKMVRSELGSDAVILNSKVVQTQGFLGLFKKKNFEVIAAIDSTEPSTQKLQLKEKNRKLPDENKTEVIREHSPKLPVLNEKTQTIDNNLVKELAELKSMMLELSSDVSSKFEKYPGPLKSMNELFIDQDIDHQIRQAVLSELVEKWYSNQNSGSFNQVQAWAKEAIISRISSFQYGGLSYTKKYVNIVGPTGVGKTTSIAKIAAECILKDQKKVAFITTDTYRIAAIEQLKTYAKILSVPVEVCYSIDDFQQAKQKYENYDIVFIDTAGRNFRNKKYVDDLQKIIDFSDEMETFLVLSLTSKLTDMKEIFEKFSSVNINKYIFTKVDETSNYGAMLNMILQYKVGVAYLTNGQNVPDDIVEATPTIIANIILGEDVR